MRLIDARAIEEIYISLKRELRAPGTSKHTDSMIGGMRRIMAEINELPTVYCVDRVIEELEKELADCGDCYEETGMRAAYIKAIEIIKRGETNER